MLSLSTTSLAALAASTVLVHASPLDSRNNDGKYKYKSKCEGFAISGIDNVLQAVDSIYYGQGALLNLTNGQQALVASDVPSFCRIQLLVYTDPSAGQFANSEVWLPDEWNGRFMGIGNGGYGGGPGYEDMAYAGVYAGFATLGSNGGHNSTSLDSAWALNNDPALIDFGGLRAIVDSTAAAKQVIEQYYGKKAFKNYWAGCSTGGRQALELAQRFPEAYDGILAGAPAADWINLLSWEAHIRNQLLPVNGSSWISGATWGVIHAEILKQCDEAIDGVADGVIENPNLCRFRPKVLACRSNAKNTTACLNQDQLSAIKKIYADYYETNQTYIFSRYEYGAEIGYTGLFGEQAFSIPQEYYRYWVFNDTSFDIATLTYDDILEAKRRNVGDITSVNPDIRAFVKRGGKLLQYHGLADQLISPGSSLRYYSSVDAFTRFNSNQKTDDFYRYFPVPGLLHCGGGPGINSIGTSQASKGAGYSPKNDFRAALVDWTENGNAPEVITGTHYETSDDGESVATFKRPLCKYPGQSKYKGKGDWKDASSWYCQGAPPNF